MADENKPREVKLEIHTDEETAQGVYSNFVIGNFTETEVTLDFVFVHPQSPKGKIRSRVILSPIHAKRLAGLLGRQIATYEQKFGEIPMRQQVQPPPPIKSDDTLN